MKPDDDFVGANTRLVWEGGPPLIVRRANGMVYSVWTLSDEDRARIAAGGVVHLAIMGETQPPLRVTVEPLDTVPGRCDEAIPNQWKCGKCGMLFVFKGDGAPSCCPHCGPV